MDELTFKPNPNAGENNDAPKKEKPSFEMDMIDLSPRKPNTETKDEAEKFFEDKKSESLEDIIEKEKQERMKAKQEQSELSSLPTPPPAAPPTNPPSAQKEKNDGIIELTLTPPPTTPPSAKKPEDKKEEKKPSEDKKPTEEKKEEKKPDKAEKPDSDKEKKADNAAFAPQQKPKKKKASSKPKAAPVENDEKKKPVPAEDKKPEEPSKPEEKASKNIEDIIPKKKVEVIPEADPETPAEIEELVIPAGLKAPEKEPEEKKPSSKDADSIESLTVSVPVFNMEVNEITAQKHDDSLEDEYKKLIALEESDSLTADDKRRLQIIRLIDLKKKGKITDYASDNLVSFLNEERRLGHDVSAFEQALAETSQPAKSVSADLKSAPSTQKPVSAPTKDDLPPLKVENKAPVHNDAPAPAPAPASKPMPKKEESKDSEKTVAEKTSGGNNLISTILENKMIVGIAALALAIIIIIIAVWSCGSGDSNEPVETTTVTTVAAETTTIAESTEPTEETTTVADTEMISAGNMIEAKVSNVIDADTIEAVIDDETYTIQMIGIEAPASWAYWGPDSKTYTKKKLLDQTITLEFDNVLYVNEEDKTTLYAYVWYDSGKTLFNDDLVINGHVKAAPTEGNSKYDAEFDRTQTIAKNDKKGLWSYTAKPTRPTVKPTGTAAKYPYITDDKVYYHRNDCAYAYDGGSKLYFSTVEDAKKYAPHPCTVCNP